MMRSFVWYSAESTAQTANHLADGRVALNGVQNPVWSDSVEVTGQIAAIEFRKRKRSEWDVETPGAGAAGSSHRVRSRLCVHDLARADNPATRLSFAEAQAKTR